MLRQEKSEPVKITFLNPLVPTRKSKVYCYRGLEAKDCATTALAKLEPGMLPIAEGPYQDEGEQVAELKERVGGNSARLLDLLTSLLLLTPGNEPDVAQAVAGFSTSFSLDHIHQSDVVLTPGAFLMHSSSETGEKLVMTREEEEIAVLLVALLRLHGHHSFLSQVKLDLNDDMEMVSSGVCVLGNEAAPLINVVMGRVHPPFGEIMLYDDPTVVNILERLRQLNIVKGIRRGLQDLSLSLEDAVRMTRSLAEESRPHDDLDHSVLHRLKLELASLSEITDLQFPTLGTRLN